MKNKMKEVNKRAKRDKKERLRKTVREEYPGDVRVIGIWDAVYKKGSMPEA